MATFGKTNVGGNTWNAADWEFACKYSIPENGNVTEISVYGVGTPGGTELRVAIYTDSAGYPAARLCYEARTGITFGANQWWDVPVDPVCSLTAGTYWIAACFVGGVEIAYAAGTADQYYEYNDTDLPDPFPGGADDYDYAASIYATYTPTVGVASRRLLVGVGL